MTNGAVEQQHSKPERSKRRVVLQDGLEHRPIRRPANDEPVSPGSPWALPPWPTLELAKWVADRLDRYLPGRGNRKLLRGAGEDAQAQLQAVMQQCVIPALRDVRDQLEAEGYPVDLEFEAMGVRLCTQGYNGRAIEYAVGASVYREPVFSLADAQVEDSAGATRSGRLHIRSRGARRTARPAQCSYAAMRRDVMHELRNQMLY